MPSEHVILDAKGISKIAFLLKEFIWRNTSDNIEKLSKIIVTRKVPTNGCVR